MSKVSTNLLAAGAALVALVLAAYGAPAWLLAAVGGAAVLATARLASRRTAGDRHREEQRLQALRHREEQLAYTAHELRTPLTAVTTAIELLRDGYTSSPEDTQMFLEQASIASRHMAFLINDVVDLAALECGRISLHVRDHRVSELIFDVAQVMRLTAQQRNVELRIDETPDDLFVSTDSGRFLQIVFNLVANAIKFSEPGKLVQLVTRPRHGEITFEVHDQGPGVPPESRSRLFTRFGRAHGQTIFGTGLGLHVCKLLVERLGGKVGFKPGAAGGSVFWFTMPRAEAAVRPAPGSEVAPAQTTPA
jgi:signal transduction histidine kinase